MESQLIEAVCCGNINRVADLLALGVSPNVKAGNVPIAELADMRGYPEISSYLERYCLLADVPVNLETIWTGSEAVESIIYEGCDSQRVLGLISRYKVNSKCLTTG
eukprot:Rmarinus@m.30006